MVKLGNVFSKIKRWCLEYVLSPWSSKVQRNTTQQQQNCNGIASNSMLSKSECLTIQGHIPINIFIFFAITSFSFSF